MEKASQLEDGQTKPNKKREQQLADDLMAVRLREAEALADLKEMKQKVMELETQVGSREQQPGRVEVVRGRGNGQ